MILHTGTTGIGTGRKPRASGDDPTVGTMVAMWFS